MDHLGARAIGPAPLQLGRTINVVAVSTGKGEIVVEGQFER